MVYFVFDLDATLADLSSAYYCIAALRVKQMLSGFIAAIFPEVLENQLDRAYSLFIKRILEQETSITPLGILRPGILQVMEQLAILKKKGRITSVIIYSNNSHLPSLEFVRDLIHMHVGSKRLISQCIHWNHPLRNVEKTMYPGMYPKTWQALSSIIVNGGSNKLVMAKDVFFFDDLDHRDLQQTLRSNYYKVTPYDSHTSVQSIVNIFMDCLHDARVDPSLFTLQLVHIFPIQPYSSTFTLDDIISIMKYVSANSNTPKNAVVPPADDGIIMMNRAIDRVKMNMVKRTKRTKHGRTFKKKRKL